MTVSTYTRSLKIREYLDKLSEIKSFLETKQEEEIRSNVDKIKVNAYWR